MCKLISSFHLFFFFFLISFLLFHTAQICALVFSKLVNNFWTHMIIELLTLAIIVFLDSQNILDTVQFLWQMLFTESITKRVLEKGVLPCDLWLLKVTVKHSCTSMVAVLSFLPLRKKMEGRQTKSFFFLCFFSRILSYLCWLQAFGPPYSERSRPWRLVEQSNPNFTWWPYFLKSKNRKSTLMC